MAVAVRGKTGLIISSQASPATINSASYDVAPQAGDILILSTHGNNDVWVSVQGVTVGTLSGWTLRASDQTSTFYGSAIWTRVATGTSADDITSFPWTGDGGAAGAMVVVAMSGATYSGIGAFANRTTTGTLAIPTASGSAGDVYVSAVQQIVAGTTTTLPGMTNIFSSTTAPADVNGPTHRALVAWETLGTAGTRTTTSAAGTSQGVTILLTATAAPASFVPQTSRPTVRVPRALRSVQSKIRVARLGPSSPSPIPQFSRSRRPSLVRRANMRVSSPRLIGKQTVNVPQVKLKRTLLPMRPRALRRSTPPIIPPSPTIRGFTSATQTLTAPNTGSIAIPNTALSAVPQTGDLLLAFVNYVDNNFTSSGVPNFSGATGWTFLNAVTDANQTWTYVYSRRATGTTSDGFTIGWFGDTASGDYQLVVHVLALQNAGNPSVSGANIPTVSATTTPIGAFGNTADLLLVDVANYAGTPTGYTTIPAGMSVVDSQQVSGSNTFSTIVYSQAQITPVAKTVTTAGTTFVTNPMQVAVPYRVNLPTYPFVAQTPRRRTPTPAHLRARKVSNPRPPATVTAPIFIPQTKYSRKAPPVRLTALRVANPLPAAAAAVTPTFIPQNTRIRTTPPRTTRRLGASVPVITANTYVPIPNRLRYARPKPSTIRTKVSSPVTTQVTATTPTFVPQNKIKRAGVPVKGLTTKVATPVPTTVVATPPVFIPQTKVKRVISPLRPRAIRVASPFLAGLQTVNVPQVKTKRVTAPFKPRSMRTSVPVPPVVTATPPTFIPQTKTKRPAAPMRTRPTRVFSPVFPAAVVVAPTFIPQAKVRRAALPLRPRSLCANNPVVPAKALVPGPIRLRHARPKPVIRRGTATPVLGLSLSVSVTDNAGVFESRTNLAPNPSGEANTSGWNWQSQSSGDTATVSQNATSPLYGSFVIRALITAPQTATSNHGMQIGSSGTVSAGDTITASVWIRPSRTNVFKFGLDFTGGGNSAAATAVSCPAGVWTQISATGVAAAGTTGVFGNLWTDSTAGSVFWQTNDIIDFDGLLIEKAATVGDFVATTAPSVTYSFVKSSTLTDVAGISDAASTLLINGAPATDNAGVSDLATSSIARGGVVTDDSGTVDQATPDLLRGTTLTDRTTMYDRVTTLISHTKSVTVTDQSGVSDTTYAYLVNRPHGSWGAQINRSHG